MSETDLLSRIYAESAEASRQRRRTRRVLQAALAVWPGADSLDYRNAAEVWKENTVFECRRRIRKERAKTIPALLLMLLAEIIIKLLLAWWQNRELTTADLTRLHRQA